MPTIDNKLKNAAQEEIGPCADSEIRRFYAGKTIFLTGSTGYMGMCLVEKLLRGCPDVKRIYVLVRAKKGISADERIKKYFDDVLFDTLRSMGTDFESKMHLIHGDLSQDDMALSDQDRNTLTEEVNIIMHNASNVKFTERMSTALKINVLGTKAMLDLAKKCQHIECFMYMSTAYSHCYQQNIMEVAYPSPANMKMVQELIATDLSTESGISKEALPNVIDKFPNTYTFTKAIAEGLVDDAGKEVVFPCVIYRPAVVLSSWKEPVEGWCGNLNGPAMLTLGYGLGIVHSVLGGDSKFDLIPVDMSINALLVAMWDATEHRSTVTGAHVYNYGSSVEKPISLTRFRKYCAPDGNLPAPSIHALWMDFGIFTNSLWYFLIAHVLFHYIPALLMDSYLYISGKKTRALSTLKKISENYEMFLYFIRGEWRIDISKTNNAIDRMSPIDRQLFFCDVRKLDWEDFCSTYWAGLKLYILKEPISTLPAAIRRMRIIKTVHYSLKYAIMLLIGYAIVRVLGLM